MVGTTLRCVSWRKRNIRRVLCNVSRNVVNAVSPTPLASLLTPRPSFFVPAILLFTRCRPPFPSIPNKRRLTFRVVLQDEAYARPSCFRRLPSTLVNVPYSVSAPECDSYKPLWTPSDRGSGARRLDNNPKRAWACERSYGR